MSVIEELTEMEAEGFAIEEYATPVPEDEREKFGISEKDDHATLALYVHNFPWDKRFEGVVFSVQDISVDEEEDHAKLNFRYKVFSNPNDLEIQKDDDAESLKTEDNEILDIFVGRMIESLLIRMSKDPVLQAKMAEMEEKDKE